ncbi:MAG: CopD family protein [Steroidobacteraceae bacterium]
MAIDVISAFVRSLSFLALFQAAGVAIFVALFGRRLLAAAAPVRRLGFVSSLAGIALVSAHYALEAARMAGEMSGAFDASLQRLVLDSPLSAAWVLRTTGLALIAASIRNESKLAAVFGVIGALVLVQAFALVGHTASDKEHVWLSGLLGLHLGIVAFWFGALWPLHIVSRTESAAGAAVLVDEFSQLALWLVPAIFVAGVLMIAMLVDRWSVFRQSYGVLLLAKIAGFAALMGLAALNKWRYGPALATTPAAGVAFRRSVAVEYGLICAVLAATAIMTTFFSPEQ